VAIDSDFQPQKAFEFSIRKKNLEKAKGLKSLLNLSLSKEI
jgi:hypothetical protein